MKKNIILFIFLFAFFMPQPDIHASMMTGIDSTFDLENKSDSNGLIEIKIGDSGELTDSLKVFLLVAFLTVLPSMAILLTCFVQVIIVLSLTRQALGTMNIPPNQVLTGLALFVTLFIMSPVIDEVKEVAYDPYSKGDITMMEMIEKGKVPLKEFMVENSKEDTLKMFLKLNEEKRPEKPEDIEFLTIVPAFAVSQIEKGLATGMMIYLIFSFIDVVVGSILMFMGMMMLPPQMISLPLKIIIFILIGGFTQIIQTIVDTVIT